MAATTSTDLERTRAAFDSWRKSRSARSPIPPPLWEQALALLNSYPLARVARELRISPTRLKKRRQEVGHLPAPAQPPAPSFLTINPVDLNVGDRPSPVSRPVHQATEVGCRLQLERSDGSRLVLSLCITDWKQLHALAMDFLHG